MLTSDDIREIIFLWGIELQKLHKNIKLQESKYRTVASIVFSDINNDIYVLDKIAFENVKKKEKIAENLEKIYSGGVHNIQVYKKSINGEYTPEYKNRNWMLRKYYHGRELDRPAYLNEIWRAEKIITFLKGLRNNTKTIELARIEVNDIENYYVNFRRSVRNNLLIFRRVENVIKFCDEFIKTFHNLPQRFCHGDLHPLNILWNKDDINVVIDWEFMGKKAENYDIGILIGCIGSENPEYLKGNFVIKIIELIKKEKLLLNISINYLFHTIILIRFTGWLSLWMKNDDNEMINLEIDYLNYLLKNRREIGENWKEI